MGKFIKIFFAGLTFIIVAVTVVIYSISALNPKVIGWKLLYSYDYESKIVPKEIQRIDGKTVKIAGYVVPLSDNYFSVSEFLLVPDPQSCIHAPPPPPNLIVWVKLEESIPSSLIPHPAWITGVFKLETTVSQYGNASYKMDGKKIEPYDGY